MTSAPSARAVCQDQQAADVARGRTTTTAMTSLPAGHSTIGRCRSSRELDQTGTVCLRRSWRLTPWTALSAGSTPTRNSDPPSKLLPSPSVSPSLNHRNYLYLHHLFFSGSYASTVRPRTANPTNNVRAFNTLMLDSKWKKKKQQPFNVQTT